jgi:hypothetical protein
MAMSSTFIAFIILLVKCGPQNVFPFYVGRSTKLLGRKRYSLLAVSSREVIFGVNGECTDAQWIDVQFQ